MKPVREAHCRLCGAPIVEMEVSAGAGFPIVVEKCEGGHWQTPDKPSARHTSSLTAEKVGDRVGA